MARLENAIWRDCHPSRELELNGLEDGDDILVLTMSKAQQQHDLLSGVTQGRHAIIAKNLDMSRMTVESSNEKEEQKRKEGQPSKNGSPKCPTCDKTNEPAEQCWKSAGGHLKPKNLKLDYPKTEETTISQDDSTNKPTTSILKNPKN